MDRTWLKAATTTRNPPSAVINELMKSGSHTPNVTRVRASTTLPSRSSSLTLLVNHSVLAPARPA
jgi:hypothetical protein